MLQVDESLQELWKMFVKSGDRRKGTHLTSRLASLEDRLKKLSVSVGNAEVSQFNDTFPHVIQPLSCSRKKKKTRKMTKTIVVMKMTIRKLQNLQEKEDHLMKMMKKAMKMK